MQFRIEFIEKELKDDIRFSHIVRSSSLLTLHILEPQETSELSSEVLYLCQLSDFSEYHEMFLKTRCRNFLIFSEEPSMPEYLENSNYLICSADFSRVFSYMNTIGTIFLSYQKWMQKLNVQVIEQVPLQTMVDTGYELIQYPMAMMNIDHQVIAYNKIPSTDDALYYCLENGYGYSFLNVINRSNPTLEEVEAHGCVETISKVSMKRLRVSKVRVTDSVSYFIGIHGSGTDPFSAADVILFDMLVKQLERLSHVLYFKSRSAQIGYAEIAEKIILNPSTDSTEFRQILNEKNIPSSGIFHLLIIKFTNELKFRTEHQYDIIQQIKKALPKCQCFLIQSMIGVLLTNEKEIDSAAEQLKYILITHDAVCACSSTYYSIFATGQIWNQLLFMLKDYQYSIEHNILFYEDYRKPYCLHSICRIFPPETLIHSAFCQIRKFDKKNSTDYMETLVVYLQNNCSMNITANILNIHRNSLLYRIRKIEELLGYEISSSEERLPMLFSSFLIQYGQEERTTTEIL